MANPNTAAYPYIGSLVNAGYLPGSYGTGGAAKNPYGGDICISDISASSCLSTATAGPRMGASYAIIVTGMSTQICNQLAKQILATLAVNSVYSNCSGTNIIRVTYTH